MKHGVLALRVIRKQDDSKATMKPRLTKLVWHSRPRLWFLGFLLLTIAASASTRPHYGGTVRGLIPHKVNSFDPSVGTEYPTDREKLARLVVETLTVSDT